MDTVKDLLKDPQRGQRRAQGVLCYLFRHVLLWRDIGHIQWAKRLQQYFDKPHNKNKPVDKGNLNKMLIADDMTWGSFVRAIDFLNPVAAQLTINLTWREGSVSTYVIAIDPAEDQTDPKVNQFGDPESEIFKPIRKKKETQPRPLNTLALMFRHIVTQEGIDLPKWEALFEEYVKNPLNGIEQTPRELTNAISTLQRSLLEPTLSWNTFRRGLLVLNMVREEYVLDLRWTNDPKIIELDPDFALSTHRAAYKDPFHMRKLK